MKKIALITMLLAFVMQSEGAPQKTQRVKIFNGKVILSHEIIPNGCVLIENGRIVDVKAGDAEFPGAELIDAKGRYVSPGFIDTHCHAGGGFDFQDGTAEDMLGAAEMHLKHGTTLIYPTSSSCADETLFQAFEAYRKADKVNTKGAAFGGFHIEGGYYSMAMKGGQDPRYIKDPDPAQYNEILARGGDIIKRWSMAPELPGALELARILTARGIQVSMAHTSALYQEAMAGYEAGFSSITHFYSMCSTVTRREALRYAGVIEAGYNTDELFVEAIADGVHLPAPLLKLIYKVKGSDRILLVTDAMRAAGLPEGGTSVLGSKKGGVQVLIEDGVAKMPDRSSFAGSIATSDRLVRTYRDQGGVNLVEAVKMMTLTPATLMKIDDKKGSLAIGKDADVILFDEGVDVSMVMINGKVIYTK